MMSKPRKTTSKNTSKPAAEREPKAKAKNKAATKTKAATKAKATTKAKAATKAKARPAAAKSSAAKKPAPAKNSTKPSADEKALRAELADLDKRIAAAFDLTERVRLKGQRAELQRRLDTLDPAYTGPQVVPAHRRTDAA